MSVTNDDIAELLETNKQRSISVEAMQTTEVTTIPLLKIIAKELILLNSTVLMLVSQNIKGP